jgi:hypothetical protein
LLAFSRVATSSVDGGLAPFCSSAIETSQSRQDPKAG